MKKLVLFLILALTPILVSADVPIGPNTFIKDSGGKVAYLGETHNYRNTPFTYAPIENTFISDNDTAFYIDNSVLKTRVSDNGRVSVKVEVDGILYEVYQRPVKLVWLNTQTKNWVDVIPDLAWPTPVHNDNKITWNFPGFDYSVLKTNGRMDYRINFRKAFLDSAVTLYNERVDSEYIALANVHAYSFVNLTDSQVVEISETRKKILVEGANKIFELSSTTLRNNVPLDTSSVEYKIKQRWVIVNEKAYLVEYVMMSEVKVMHEKFPNADIWHNVSTVVLAATGRIEDADMQDYPNRNSGSSTSLTLYDTGANQWRALMRLKDLHNSIGYSKNITSMGCSLYVWLDFSSDGEDTVFFYRCTKPWVEGSGTKTEADSNSITPDMWDKVINTDGLAWGNTRATLRDNSATENSGDGTGYDATATAFDTILIDGTDGYWIEIDIDTAIANDAYNTDGEFSFVIEKSTQEANEEVIYFYSTEGSVATKPRFWIEYEDKPGTVVLEDASKIDVVDIGKSNIHNEDTNYETINPFNVGVRYDWMRYIVRYDTTFSEAIDSIVFYKTIWGVNFGGGVDDTMRFHSTFIDRAFYPSAVTWNNYWDASIGGSGIDSAWSSPGANGAADTTGGHIIAPEMWTGSIDQRVVGDLVSIKLAESASAYPPHSADAAFLVFTSDIAGKTFYRFYSDEETILPERRPYIIVYYTEATAVGKYLRFYR